MSMEGSGVRTGSAASETIDNPHLSSRAGATTLAHFERPRAETETTLALIADPHVSTDKEGTWKVFHRTATRLRTALSDADDRDVDGIVFAGDLTEDGRPEDFEAVADLLADLRAPFVAVPGNHDVPKAFKDHETPPVSAFEEQFTPGELPFRVRFAGVDVLGLNSAAAPDGSLDATHDGAISSDQLDWLDATLPETDASLVVTHHNLAGLDACVPEGGYAPHPPVGDAASLAGALADQDALHVSGHVHLPAVTEVGCEGITVPGFVAPALSSFPQAYTLVEVGPEGTTLRLVPVADPEGVAEAYELAQSHSTRSKDVSEMVEAQLSALPLVDER